MITMSLVVYHLLIREIGTLDGFLGGVRSILTCAETKMWFLLYGTRWGSSKYSRKKMMSPNFMNKHILWFIMTIGFTVLASDELYCLVNGIRIVFRKEDNSFVGSYQNGSKNLCSRFRFLLTDSRTLTDDNSLKWILLQ